MLSEYIWPGNKNMKFGERERQKKELIKVKNVKSEMR